MRWGFALIAWLALPASAAGQTPLTAGQAALTAEQAPLTAEQARLTLSAALAQAAAAHPDTPGARAAARAAYAELAIARDLLAVQEEIWAMSQDMAAAGARSVGGQMVRDDQAGMVLEMARVGLDRSRAQQQSRIAEYRLNERLGRPPEAPVEPLAPREPGPTGAPDMAADATPHQARRLLEAWARVEGARERGRIMTSTVLPQATLGFAAARAAYVTGHGTYVAVVAAHHRLFEMRLEHADILAEETRALVALAEAMEGAAPEEAH
jgi:outer membrane protein TolC